MTVFATSGVPVLLVAQFESNGTAAEPELPITLTITPAAGGAAIVTETTLGNPSVGVYTYTWTPPAEIGNYIISWDPSGDDLAAIETATVYAAVTGTWATVEQVAGQTGTTVTAQTLALASSMIETFTGADIELPDDAITTKDRKHLRKATGWQAVWIAGKPGFLTERENAATVSSDTQTITREDRMDTLCAPLARREIMSLSWIGTRTVFVPPMSARARERNFLNEASDPIGFGGEGAIP
jgi:hypothetical protein